MHGEGHQNITLKDVTTKANADIGTYTIILNSANFVVRRPSLRAPVQSPLSFLLFSLLFHI